jgi:hypothetical protein
VFDVKAILTLAISCEGGVHSLSGSAVTQLLGINDAAIAVGF